MVDHYEDTAANMFEEGLPAGPRLEEIRKIILHDVNVNLKPHTIKALLVQYGELEELHIPINQSNFKHYREGVMTVFATFVNFR